MKYKSLTHLIILSVLLFFWQCDDANKRHPRILLPAGEENEIHQQIANSEVWAKMHQTIIDESEQILQLDPLERKQIGRRLLGTSREYLRRIFYLSYAYRMSGDVRFASHAEIHMLKAAGFSDWNPSHFLDVGEMTMALAIGYDWLFNKLSDESKSIIKEAIVKKGIEPSFDEKYNWFLNAEHNWNQVCNAGMAYGALAVMEDYPQLADSVINRAFETIPKAMIDYQPDGAYPEGYSYWGYGTTFNVLFLSAMETYFGTDRGLAETPGFLKTAGFLQHMLAPSGDCFNWGDCGTGGSLKPAMFWFAKKNNDPSLLWMEKQFLQTDDLSQFTKNRVLPALMIWGRNISIDEINPPASRVWVGQGKNPVALMRTSWYNDAMYLGFKVGSPSVNHGHMDIGSFIFEDDGIRWAMDFGSQGYHSLESKGMNIFGRTQDAERWTIFRLNNYAHNTLTIDGQLQRVDGYANIDHYSEEDDFMYAVSDISAVYKGQLDQATRGTGIVNGSYAVIRDEVKALDKPSLVRWNMVTPAEVELTSEGAVLSKEGKMLYVKVNGPASLKMKTWSTAPTTDYDAENPGTVMVGFEYRLPVNSTAETEVLLIPENALDSAEFINMKLSDWPNQKP